MHVSATRSVPMVMLMISCAAVSPAPSFDAGLMATVAVDSRVERGQEYGPKHAPRDLSPFEEDPRVLPRGTVVRILAREDAVMRSRFLEDSPFVPVVVVSSPITPYVGLKAWIHRATLTLDRIAHVP